MEFTSRLLAELVVATPIGRIDQDSAEQFKAALAPLLDACVAEQCRIVLDFSGVDYISSVGLRVLMMAAKQVKDQRGELVIAGLQPLVREVFEITRFDLLFTLFSTLREAIAKLSPAARAALDGA